MLLPESDIDEVEKFLIQYLRPLFNVHHNPEVRKLFRR